MPDLDDLLRDSLRSAEVSAPSADGLLDAVHAGVAARAARRRQFAVAGAAAAALTVVAAVAAISGLRSGGGETHTLVDASPRPYTAPGMQTVSFLGVEVLAPESWPVRPNTRCPATREDAVQITDLGPHPQCNEPEPRTVSTVTLEFANRGLVDNGLTLSQRTTVDGVPARRGERRLGDGRTEVAVEVAALGVQVVAVSPDRQLARRLVTSTRVRPVDSLGCQDKPPSLTPAPPAGTGPFVAGGPTGAVVCRYYYATRRDGTPNVPRLVRSVALSRAEAARYAEVLNRLPTRAADGSARECNQDRYLIHFRYAGGHAAEVVADIGSCLPVAVTNGRDVRAVDDTLDRMLRTMAGPSGRACFSDHPMPGCP
jgi:hypothetical protein